MCRQPQISQYFREKVGNIKFSGLTLINCSHSGELSVFWVSSEYACWSYISGGSSQFSSSKNSSLWGRWQTAHWSENSTCWWPQSRWVLKKGLFINQVPPNTWVDQPVDEKYDHLDEVSSSKFVLLLFIMLYKAVHLTFGSVYEIL